MTFYGGAQPYPLTVDIGYPASRARWSVLARLPLGIPVLFFSLLLNIGATFAIWAAILVSGRVPSWLFTFQVNVGRWHTRGAAFLLLLTDDHPVFEGKHPVCRRYVGDLVKEDVRGSLVGVRSGRGVW